MSEVQLPPSRYRQPDPLSPGPISDRNTFEDWETEVSNQLALRADRHGWATVPYVWKYSAANQIKADSVGILTNRFEAGMKLRFKQPGSASFVYAYVTSVSNNLLNIVTNTTATLANAPIKDLSFSRDESPVGFPKSLNFSPSLVVVAPLTITGLSVTYAHFKITDKWVNLSLAAYFESTNTGVAVSFTAPVACAVTNAKNAGYGYLNDANVPYGLAVDITSNTSNVLVTAIQRTFATGNPYWIYLGLTYPI